MPRVSLTLLAGAVAAACLAGCPDVPAREGQPRAGVNATSAFVPLSERDQATHADLAVAGDGTLHAIYRGTPSQADFRRQLLYRASQDGGATWSAPVVLSEGGPHRHAGVGRLTFDHAGRLYATWKSTEGDEDAPSGAMVAGTLMVRCLEDGRWGDAFQVGALGQAISWFAAPGPEGRLTLVWNEIQPFEGSFLTNPHHAGLIQRVDLAGARAAAAQELVRSAVQDATVDGYQGLSGYVGADGTVHWLAQRLPAGQGGRNVELVYGVGGRVTSLAPLAAYYADEALGMKHPPQLLYDAASVPHMVLLEDRAGAPRVLDVPLRADATTTVLLATEQGGAIDGFNAEQGPRGDMAVTASLKTSNGVSDVFDLYATTHADGRWQSRGNLTNNQASEKFVGATALGTTMTTSVRFNSQFTAPALDARGGLHVVFVNLRTGWVTDERGTRTGTFTYAGGHATPMVYFTRL